MSVTGLTVPCVATTVTAAPPAVSALPCASFSFTVTAVWLVPSAVNELVPTSILLFTIDGVPATNWTVAVSVNAAPPTVALTVAVPAVVGAVSVAV
ncbi:hypothetical protein D3C87_1820120 [compost metagenome]